MVVPPLPDLTTLTSVQKDALIITLWEQVVPLKARLTALEQRLEPPKTPDNSSVPPSKGQKANRAETSKPAGPGKGSLGRKGGSRSLMAEPDQMVSAKAAGCRYCGTVLGEADHHLHSRCDRIELPRVRPVVTRVERYAGQCSCCGGTTLAAVPDGLEEGSPFGPSIVAMALYLRFTHAISYRRLCRLFEHLFGLAISEGALDALFRRAKLAFDGAKAAILARLRRSRIVCLDETSVRIDGRTCWNWVFQNEQLVIHVVHKSRGAGVVAEVMGGHLGVRSVRRPAGRSGDWRACRPVAGLPRPPVALLPVRHRRRRHRLSAAHEGTAAAAPSSWHAGARDSRPARASSTAGASTTTSTPSWRSAPRTGTASASENATARSATTSSPS